MPFPLNGNTPDIKQINQSQPKFQSQFGADEASHKDTSIFSTYDNDKNSKIELKDAATKNYLVQQQKDVKTENVSKDILQNVQFDVKAKYKEAMQKMFKNFDYDAKAPTSVDRDLEVKQNLDIQASSINEAIQKDYTAEIEKVKKQMEAAKNDPEVKQLKQDYKTAKSEFENHLKQDGIFADMADTTSKLWNNSVIKLTGNTADMVRQDLEKYSSLLTKLDKTSDPKQRQQIKSELKSMDIINRVRDYNKSQETGAVAAEIGVGVGATILSGGNAAVGAAIVGAAKFADETSKDIKQDNLDLTTAKGWQNLGENAMIGARDGVITYGAGKFVKGAINVGGNVLNSTGTGRKLVTKTGTYLVSSGAIIRYGAKGLSFAGKKVAGKAVGGEMKETFNNAYNSFSTNSNSNNPQTTYITPKNMPPRG